MSGDDDRQSGIKGFSVGFGPAAAEAPRALSPAPPYRLLIAGDFGMAEEGRRLGLPGDLAELIGEARPAVEVSAQNLLGSFPVTLSETVSLGSLADLKPPSIARKLRAVSEGADLMAGNATTASVYDDRRYDRLTALASRQETSVTDGTQSDDAGGDGGFASFLRMNDATANKRPRQDASPADLVASFIDENVAPARVASKSTAGRSAAAELLDAQAFAFLSHPRLSQVLENWHALRLLVELKGAARGIEITLLQVSVEAGAAAMRELLAGADGALHEELFDLVLLSNRCTARQGGADLLRSLAEAAEAFDLAALTTLTPDFADVPVDDLATMDAPHQALESAGFEAFNALRTASAARHLGVFWNDVLAIEASPCNPELYAPAAWAAAIAALRAVAATGWPSVRGGQDALSGFAVAERTFRGRQVAIATRTVAGEECVGGLASVGIGVLNGRLDRDSVHIARAPSFSASRADGGGTTRLDDRLVLSRIGQLLQATVPDVLASDGAPAEKAAALEERLAEFAQSMPQAPRFDVAATSGDDGAPLLSIAVGLPEGVASRRRFDFDIPV